MSEHIYDYLFPYIIVNHHTVSANLNCDLSQLSYVGCVSLRHCYFCYFRDFCDFCDLPPYEKVKSAHRKLHLNKSVIGARTTFQSIGKLITQNIIVNRSGEIATASSDRFRQTSDTVLTLDYWLLYVSIHIEAV
ncbi:uncharacterized protein LOC126295237 [Schistocerca gregaria]|uniref:uncharacterized protein LOC126295237 n=1 Tax=Schistocerca gregaria TaxID=7010 RepID=UPI00211E65BD|nr:uncharacterized protein LOC126295237 [Schistocerca gregaria]